MNKYNSFILLKILGFLQHLLQTVLVERYTEKHKLSSV